MGPRLQVARTNLFDFAWNVKAAVRASQQPDAQHYNLWLIDALIDVCKGAFEGAHAPPAVRNMQRLDTALQPLTWRGINWEGMQQLKAQGAHALTLSSLRSQADRDKVLQHPLLVLRQDAAGIARETGACSPARSDSELSCSG